MHESAPGAVPGRGIRLSVIVPAHNAAGTLAECLRALTVSPPGIASEIIVVDDHSTDATAAIAAGFSCRVVRSPRRGVAAARNAGIRAAQGSLLLFIDADVSVHPDTLSRFLHCLDIHPDLSVIQGHFDDTSYSDSRFSRFVLHRHRYCVASVLDGHDLVPSLTLESGCFLARREVFLQAGMFDETWIANHGAEEHELAVRIARQYRICYAAGLGVTHRYVNFFRMYRLMFLRSANFAMLTFAQRQRGNFIRLHATTVPWRDPGSILLLTAAVLALPMWYWSAPLAAGLSGACIASYYAVNFPFWHYLCRYGRTYALIAAPLLNALLLLPRGAGVLAAAWMFYLRRRPDWKI